MHARLPSMASRTGPHPLIRLGSVGVLLLPLTLLLAAGAHNPHTESQLFWLGAGVQAVACLASLWVTRFGRESSSSVVILLYVIALGCIVVGSPGQLDWRLHVSRSILLVIPVVFFALQCLRDSGATTIRRARLLAARLQARKDWPGDLMQCRFLPEVKALRECLHVDASPAIEMLADHRPAVRVAALAALEYRLSWRPGQTEVILQLAKRAQEPEVRATAVNALANAEDRGMVESLGELLRDRSALVRQTATEALLWNSEQRWYWLRDLIRNALNDPTCLGDGALRLGGNALTQETLNDLHAWCAEKGLISQRAAATLGAYYGQMLATGGTSELPDRLRKHLLGSTTPAMLRVELARLLIDHRELDAGALRQLIQSSMPAPVRLLAAERLLSIDSSPEAVAALHELARLPNREIALATAEVVQRMLNIDLGVPRDQGLPAVHSTAAADIARRVLSWANQNDLSMAPLSSHSESRVTHRSESHVEL